MTRATIKLGLAALSLTVTLATWATWARKDTGVALPGPQPAVETLDPAPVPTLVPPLSGPQWTGRPIGPGLNLPPIPDISAPRAFPPPLARTRSSR